MRHAYVARAPHDPRRKPSSHRRERRMKAHEVTSLPTGAVGIRWWIRPALVGVAASRPQALGMVDCRGQARPCASQDHPQAALEAATRFGGAEAFRIASGTFFGNAARAGSGLASMEPLHKGLTIPTANVTNTTLWDAGDLNSPIGHEAFPNGGRVNVGAYGGTVGASKSCFGGAGDNALTAGRRSAIVPSDARSCAPVCVPAARIFPLAIAWQ